MKAQNKNHRINISSIYGKTHRKFAASFMNAFVLSLHSGFQHEENPRFANFNHKLFPNNGFPLFVEVQDNVEDITRTIEFKTSVKGNIQNKIERFNIRLWKEEAIPIEYVQTIQIDKKIVRILSTDHVVPSWL